MPDRKDIAGYALAVTITTDIMDPDEAIRWVREQLAASLGTQGDVGEGAAGSAGWHSATIGTPRWQVNSVRAVYKAETR